MKTNLIKTALCSLLALVAITTVSNAQTPYQRYQQQMEYQRQIEAQRRYIAEINRQRAEREEERQRQLEADREEARRLNQENRDRRQATENFRTNREPNVVQRRLIRTERRGDGGHIPYYTAKIYRVVYDNGTSEEVEE